MYKKISIILFSILLHANTVYAAPQQLKMPHCLAQSLTVEHKVLAANDFFKLVEVDMSQLDDISRLADQTACGRYINLSGQFKQASGENSRQKATNLLQSKPAVQPRAFARPGKISDDPEIKKALKDIKGDNILKTLTHLTQYQNRSAMLSSGKKAPIWIKSHLDVLAKASGRDDVETYFVDTNCRVPQPSVVAVIGKNLKKPGVIIGAHIDTLGRNEHERMPGAGDDGSGSASILEAARAMMNSDIPLKRPVYFVWYAAEEIGLMGSQAVVYDFKRNQKPIDAVIQFDMTGYRSDRDDPTMFVFTDYTDQKLTTFVAQLIEHYIQVPIKYSKCGYGCSDHASWTEVGIPAAFPCESSFEDHNPYIHSSRDTMDLLVTEHMVNFSKLALAFGLELAKK